MSWARSPTPDTTLSSGCSLVTPPSAARHPAFAPACSAQGPATLPGSRVIQCGDGPAPALPPMRRARSSRWAPETLELMRSSPASRAPSASQLWGRPASSCRPWRGHGHLRAPRALQTAPPAGWGWPRAQRQRPLEKSRRLLTPCLSLKAWSVRLWNWSSESPQSRRCWSAGLTPHVPTVPFSTPHYTGFRLLEPNTKL